MSIDQIFTYESLSYHYEDLQTAYINSSSTTKKRSIQFNNLPNELKTIRNKHSRKIKLKQLVKGSN